MANRFTDIIGTLRSTFRIGKATVDTSGTSVAATILRSSNTGILINDTLGLAFNSGGGTLGMSYVTTNKFAFKGSASGPEFFCGSAPYVEANGATGTGARISFDSGGSVSLPTYAFNGNNYGTGFYLKTGYTAASKIALLTTPASSVQGQYCVDWSLGTQDNFHASADAVAPFLNFLKSRGVTYTPTAVTTGDSLGAVTGKGYVGGTGLYVETGRIEFLSTGTVADNSTGLGGFISFKTRVVGAALLEVFRATANGIKALVYEPTVQTISFSATPTINPMLGGTCDLTLTGNVTACTVSAGVDGHKLTLRLKQDGTGSRTFAFDSSVAFGTDITAVTLTTTANKTDLIVLEYNTTAAKWWVASFIKGF